MNKWDYKKTADKTVKWIQKQVKQAGAKGVVLGLSGGIDSAVVAVLAQRAVGKNLLGVIMPCGSNPQDEKDARLLARKFRIKTRTFKLDSPYKSFQKLLPKGTKMAQANIKPRMRMITVYHMAQSMGYLVAGTGNKSELMVGYFTKYGDGGVDLLPIGNLYKTEVWELARTLNIPDPLIEKAPSAGLWSNQTDEGELGMSYETLDHCLEGLEKGKSKGLPKKELAKVKRLVKCSAHKRVLAPICK